MALWWGVDSNRRQLCQAAAAAQIYRELLELSSTFLGLLQGSYPPGELLLLLQSLIFDRASPSLIGFQSVANPRQSWRSSANALQLAVSMSSALDILSSSCIVSYHSSGRERKIWHVC